MEATHKIIWSPSALDDIRQLRLFLSERNPTAAARIMREIGAAVNQLAAFPAIGRPGRVPTTREWVVAGRPYVVIYGMGDELVEIIRVIHGARQWPPS